MSSMHVLEKLFQKWDEPGIPVSLVSSRNGTIVDRKEYEVRVSVVRE